MCIIGGWSFLLVRHILSDRLFWYDLLGRVLVPHCLHLIWSSYQKHGWLSYHCRPWYFFLRQVRQFLFMESLLFNFLSEYFWTCTIILVPRVTQPPVFVVNEQGSDARKSYKTSLLSFGYSEIMIIRARMTCIYLYILTYLGLTKNTRLYVYWIL